MSGEVTWSQLTDEQRDYIRKQPAFFDDSENDLRSYAYKMHKGQLAVRIPDLLKGVFSI